MIFQDPEKLKKCPFFRKLKNHQKMLGLKKYREFRNPGFLEIKEEAEILMICQDQENLRKIRGATIPSQKAK